MGYNIHFVGLVCFNRFAAGVKVLLPDGRRGHVASVIARPGTVIDSNWWGPKSEHAKGIFPITEKNTKLRFTGDSPLQESHLDEYSFLPNLSRHVESGEFRLSDNPATIATARLTNGTLTVSKHPGDDSFALVSTFFIPHDGQVRVEADGERFIRLKPGAEIGISNVPGEHHSHGNGAPGARDDDNDFHHFKLYLTLAAEPKPTLKSPENKNRPRLKSDHPVFHTPPRAIKIGCSNTGCC